MVRSIAAAVVLAGLAVSSADAAFVSFASDNDHRSFTFRGLGPNVEDAQDRVDPFTLLVDDNNGPRPALSFQVEFDASFTIAPRANVALGGGSFLHAYDLNGVFSFHDINTGELLLSAVVSTGSFSALGDATSWGTSAGIQGNNQGGSMVQYTWNGPDLPEYQLFHGQSSVGPADFAFTLTVLNSVGAAPIVGAPLNNDGLPAAPWASEGSFSGSLFTVPGPGSIAVGGLSLALLSGRRRRA